MAKGLHAFLAGSEAESIAYLEGIERSRPDRPEGPFMLGYVRWIKAREIGHRGSEEAERNFHIFMRKTQEAVDRAQAIRDQDPRDALNLLFLSASFGYRAQFHLERREYWPALRNALPSRRYLDETLQADPALVDANMGKGMYEYYVATLPKVIKILGFLRGDKERGLSLIAHAAREGRYVKPEAAWLLQDLLCMREHRCEEALPWIEDLVKQHPQNLQMRLGAEKVYMRLARYEEAVRISTRLIEDIGKGLVPETWRPYFQYRRAMAMTYGGDAADAANAFRELQARADLPVEFKPWIALRLGNALDLIGRRDAALQQYRSILRSREAKGELIAAARGYLDAPFKTKAPVVVPSVHFLGMTPLKEP